MAKIKKIYVTNENGEEELAYLLSISDAIIHTTNNETVKKVLDDLSGTVNYLKTTTFSGVAIDTISEKEIQEIWEGTYGKDPEYGGGW